MSWKFAEALCNSVFSVEKDSPLISFRFIAARAFPASDMFLNCTNAKPRFFPSAQT